MNQQRIRNLDDSVIAAGDTERGKATPAERERFRKLADQWEAETLFLSFSDQAAAHWAHQAIVGMGEPAVPLILERMRKQGGHWFHALQAITGARPVQPDARGDIGAMQSAWLEWGERNGYA